MQCAALKKKGKGLCAKHERKGAFILTRAKQSPSTFPSPARLIGVIDVKFATPGGGKSL